LTKHKSFLEQLNDLLEPIAVGEGFEIVRIKLTGGQSRPVLQIMLERPDGTMDIQSCEKLSREFSVNLDLHDIIKHEYTLEVSSPGIDRPLTRIKDFERWKGFETYIELSDKFEGRKRFRGLILCVEVHDNNECILIKDQNGIEYKLPFFLISNAKLILTDELLKATKNGTLIHGFSVEDQDAKQQSMKEGFKPIDNKKRQQQTKQKTIPALKEELC
jgi:ribosome maturation factor RimP